MDVAVWFALGMASWIVFIAMVRGDGPIPRIQHSVRAWWHKVTWDERMNRPNEYGDILGNVLGTVGVIAIVCIVLFGLTFLGTLWFRFMFVPVVSS